MVRTTLANAPRVARSDLHGIAEKIIMMREFGIAFLQSFGMTFLSLLLHYVISGSGIWGDDELDFGEWIKLVWQLALFCLCLACLKVFVLPK
ncbi:phosphate ABC transporter permease [Kingella kingae]|uniref:phosphate ABC transporter permease n=2 Tax=Kingella kingae TaxID=504 RepID=UPI00254E7C3D|nr:phosphate ABC transporter permease [Kingella kingae]MDK4585244.1 phosphate ABC transporter permease [Kingella kingae]MDK4643113.1 phosphate ABC transporter permease [Kingella kingae]